MRHVENQFFYHLDTKNSFEIGKIYHIGKNYNPFFAFYEKYSPGSISINTKMNEVLFESMKYIRERIYEDVRLEVNPNLPSRMNCLWVLPDSFLETRLNYWSHQTGSKKLVKLSCTGVIHRADQRFLITEPFNLPLQRYMANKYWSGEIMEESNKIENEEILFTGAVQAIEAHCF